jgi:hypothetical protein
MNNIQQSRKSLRVVVLAAVVFLGTLGTAMTAAAQELRNLQTPKSPLVLKALGSFYVGGEMISQTATEIGLYGGGQLVVQPDVRAVHDPAGQREDTGGDAPWRDPVRQDLRDHAGWPDGLG